MIKNEVQSELLKYLKSHLWTIGEENDGSSLFVEETNFWKIFLNKYWDNFLFNYFLRKSGKIWISSFQWQKKIRFDQSCYTPSPKKTLLRPVRRSKNHYHFQSQPTSKNFFFRQLFFFALFFFIHKGTMRKVF